MIAIIALSLCLVPFIVEAAVAYHVVVSSSPQSPVPYTVNSVQLDCSVTPLPPAPVEYRWTASPNFFSTSDPSSSNFSIPTATASISRYSIRHPTYFCHVDSNGTKVAAGKLTLTIQGYLQYVSAPFVQFTPGDDVILQFNISNYIYARISIRTTHWFYKGRCIDCCSCDHYQLDLNNTQLTIINASENDTGQYEVRVTELDWYGGESEKCNKLILNELQHQAAYAPVVYQLTLEDKFSKDTNNEALYYGVLDQPVVATKKYEEPSIVQMYGMLQFYSNGRPKSSLLTNGKPFYGTNQSHLVMNIPQYNESWAGDYTIASYVFCLDLSDELYYQGCGYRSDIFICHYFNIHYVLQSILQLSITDTEPPLLEIHANHSIVQRKSTNHVTVTLNCSAAGGNPKEYTVQLMKEGEQLMSTTSGPAVLLYSPSHYQQQFGLFTCSVVNEYFNINKSVLIQEQVSIQGLWLFCGPGVTLHNTLEMQTSIKHAIVNTMNSISSSWSITNDSLQNCSTDTTIVSVYYTCDLVYSSPSGTVTASSIISRTQEWLLQQEFNIVVRTNEATLELSKLCLLQRDDSSMANCSRVREKLAETIASCIASAIASTTVSTPASTQGSPSASGLPTTTAHTSNNAGPVTGGFIGGFLGGLLTCLSGIAVYFMINYILSKRKTSTTTSTKDIELQTNTAYDTVKYEQPRAPQRHVQPPPRHAQPPPCHVQSLPRHVKPPPRRAQPPLQDSGDHSTYENVMTNYKISSFIHSGTTKTT